MSKVEGMDKHEYRRMMTEIERNGDFVVNRDLDEWTGILGGYNSLLSYLEQCRPDQSTPLTLLDVGTGNGNAFLALRHIKKKQEKKNWKFIATGLVEYPDVRERLDEFHLCPATDLSEHIGAESVNLLTAVRSISYSQEKDVPQVLMTVAKILSPGGVARVLFKPETRNHTDGDMTRKQFLNAARTCTNIGLTLRKFEEEIAGFDMRTLPFFKVIDPQDAETIISDAQNQLVIIKARRLGDITGNVSHIRTVGRFIQHDYKECFEVGNILARKQGKMHGNVYTNPL